MTTRRGHAALLGALVAFALTATAQAKAATWTVNTLSDAASSEAECAGAAGDCSLRQAVDKAASADTIRFAVSGTITLSRGPLQIFGRSLKIAGPGAGKLTLDGGGKDRIFTVTTDPAAAAGRADLTLSGMTLTHGTAPISPSGTTTPGGKAVPVAYGGAVLDAAPGRLTLDHTVFTADSAGGGSVLGVGGAVALTATGTRLTVLDSTFSADTAGSAGGSAYGSGTGEGGAVVSFDSAEISGSTFAADKAGGKAGSGLFSGVGFGGAMKVALGSVAVTNSTVEGNSAGDSAAALGARAGQGNGGAILVPSASFTSSTVDANTTGGSSAFGDNPVLAVNELQARATIVSNPGTSCQRQAFLSVYSLEGPTGQTSCGFDLTSADPLLQPLAANGGPTQTQALGGGSPAVDAAPAASCPTQVDQRGEPRPDGAETACDIGAYETQPPQSANDSGRAAISVREHARYLRNRRAHGRRHSRRSAPRATSIARSPLSTRATPTCGPGGGITGTTFTSTTIDHTTPYLLPERDAWATQVTARMQGGSSVFSETVAAPPGDPMVEAAQARARKALTDAGAAGIQGPTEAGPITSSGTPTAIESLGGPPTVTVTVTIGPKLIYVGPQAQTPFCVVAGTTNIDTKVTTEHYDSYQASGTARASVALVGSSGFGLSSLYLSCTGAKLALINAQRSGGSRVAVAGLAVKSLIGKRVKVYEKLLGKTRLKGSVTIGPDGGFHLKVKSPGGGRLSYTARYFAKVGSIRSKPRTLARLRLTLTAAAVAGGHLTLSGKAKPPLLKKRQKVSILRQVSCKRKVVVATTRLQRNGRFKAHLSVPNGAGVALYVARAQVRKNKRTKQPVTAFTLPFQVSL